MKTLLTAIVFVLTAVSAQAGVFGDVTDKALAKSCYKNTEHYASGYGIELKSNYSYWSARKANDELSPEDAAEIKIEFTTTNGRTQWIWCSFTSDRKVTGFTGVFELDSMEYNGETVYTVLRYNTPQKF